tara:strand:+ start:122 stop:343 length:222 start_codon:yes stop_codon:yes gene_type:complete
MQKIINGIAIFSGVVALGVVGLGGYVFIRKDAIIEDVKSKITEAALGSVTGSLPDMLPDSTSGPIDLPVPMPF